MTAARPRLVPGRSFPPYSFVPGRFPHPVSDPAGHSHEQHHEKPAPLDPAQWKLNEDYLFGFDLFNHGYYWEAHEIWEGLWHAAGRTGPVANLLQGLIKLAAAGVKVREGKQAGTLALARGAADLFAKAADALPGQAQFLGLRFADLSHFCQRAQEHASETPDCDSGVRIVFPFVLLPAEAS